MSHAVVYTRAQLGIEAPRVAVETHLSNGLPAFNIVGLAQTAVKESKDRVRSALLNSHFEFPTAKITVNLAPADIPKQGGRYDLAVAIGILLASGQLTAESLEQAEFYGELALNGELRRVSGLLPALIKAATAQSTTYLPKSNCSEAGLLPDNEAFAAGHLLELCAHLNGNQGLPAVAHTELSSQVRAGDFAEVVGQQQAKRALEIAAAGQHNVLFTGPPGCGKTMLASRLPSILPELSEAEALEVAAIHSLTQGAVTNTLSSSPPFRAPHHNSSCAALVGGGSQPQPGEVSLAHRGILFLDELPEFPRNVIEVLREPMDSGHIEIARARGSARFPCRFLLVAARNSCRCGLHQENSSRNATALSSKTRIQCRCTPDQIEAYRRKVSGPILDRIDIHVSLNRISPRELESRQDAAESSRQIARRVTKARNIQLHRHQCLNSDLSAAAIKQYCALEPHTANMLFEAGDRLELSARAFHKVLKVARTIADLDNQQDVSSKHVMEALAYRTDA